jgi:hypothetical protein
VIKVDCAGCGEELDRPGAVLLSKPLADGTCRKRHLCATCENAVERCLAYIDGKVALAARGFVP